MTVKTFLLRPCTAALVFALSALFCLETQAQFAGMMMSKARKDRAKRAMTPTKVNADSMDIDIAHDKITLLGNVEVDDPEMNIKCRKMEIFLENKKKAETSEKKEESDDPGSTKQVSRIECSGDVVISRSSEEKVAGSEVQKAYAGKAVYNLLNDTITLTENNPVIVSGPNRLAGEKIEVNIKTERIIVIGAKSQTAGGLLKK
jgi:lipopolysaccharide transport protein LptA